MAYPHPCVSENLLLSFSMSSTPNRSPGTVSGALTEKGGSVTFFGLHSIFAILGAFWEGFPIAGNACLVSVNHYGIRNDESEHVCGVGQTRADRLPVFVSPELRESEPVRNFHRVFVLCSQGQ